MDDSDSFSSIRNINRSENEKTEAKLTGKAVFCLVVSAFCCAFQFGWNIGVLNTPAEVIQNFMNVTYYKEHDKYINPSSLTFLWSLANGIFTFTGMFGGVASGWICDRYGRKNAMLIANTFVIFSAVGGILGILILIPKPLNSYVPFLVGRAFAGIVAGLFSGIGPMYLTEIVPRNYRGISGVFNQLSIVLGLLVSNIFGLPQLLGTDKLWPYLMGACLVPTITLYLFAPFITETPKYVYLNKKDRSKTQEILKKLRGQNAAHIIEDEMNEMAEEQMKQGLEVSYKDIFTKKQYYRPLICAVTLQCSQQFSGINAVIFYSTEIFTSVGLKEDTWAVYATIMLSVVQLVMTFAAMTLIERAGRRVLLLAGLSGMCLFSVGLAVSRVLSATHPGFKYMSVVSTVAYIIFFSIAPGAVPWFITAEIFNSNARGKASSIAVLANWFSNLIVTISFPFIEKAIGSYSFLVFAALLVSFVSFVFLKVPETKGKTIEEISRHFDD